ncbi:MAG: VIT domain-containing protein [Lacunisphaera sp.]
MNIALSLHALCRALSLAMLVASAATWLDAQRISVTDPKATPVFVESATISTEVTGRIAITSFDLIFRNPNSRVLEGSFEFPLLDGQSVVSFALDINGRLREAVPVEKNRGRAVFEEIERRGVDPALLEKTAGNNYRARIYPIPANGTRRVVISYQETLARDTSDSDYRLVLNFPTPLERFRLAVNVHTGDKTLPKIKTTLPLDLPSWQNAKLLVIEQKRFNARGVFELELPRAEGAQAVTEHRGGNEYFYAEVPVPTFKPVVRPNPTVVGLLWDGSGSGRERDHGRELALLDAWFAAVRDVEVRLTVFRDHAATPILFKVENGNWTKLRRELKQMVYDGGTSFDGLVDDPAVGEWLMFSDGLLNYGVAQTATVLPFHAPVHTILASSQANPALLRGIAQRQAGEFINLLNTAPEAGARLLQLESLRVLRLEHNPEEVAQAFPDINSPVGEGTLIITGILKTPSTMIHLSLGHDASDAREIELPVRAGENSGRLAAHAWAVMKIASLEPDFAANREDIRRTSQEFGVVTADTSLIVLETLQDYLRYDIAPPEELRAEWEASRQSSVQMRGKDRNAQLDRIAQLFAEKQKWWETKFSKNPPLAPSIEPGKTAHSRTAPAVESLESADETLVLSPFEVTASADIGYSASATLAGNRIRTELSDVGSATNVVTQQFLSDTGTRNSGNLLSGSSNTEAAGQSGNFTGAPENKPNPANITLQHWEAKAGYLDRLRRAGVEKRYAVYLEERSDHLRQPGFFLDVAEFFFEAKNSELALRILSNLAELQLDDPSLLRVLAHRLVQAGRPDLARPLFEHVLTLRPEEPQSRRDLALVCSTLKQDQRAIDLLWEVVAQPWDARFPEIEMIALGELNAIIATSGEKLDLSRIDARFRRNLPVGLRVILTWDTDACDIDLWVNDPSGEQAIYSHPRTTQGGRMSRDFTNGYGPEEFLLRNPQPGKYVVRINYFGDHRQTALGPVTAQIRLITGFGTPAEKEQRVTMRLNDKDENLTVGEIEIGK